MDEQFIIPEGWEEITEQPAQGLPKGWEEVTENSGSGLPMIVANTPTGIPKYDLDRTAEAIGAEESSGNYGAVGKPVKGKRAYGKYQIMEQNIPEWSKQALGRSISLEEFKNSPELQDKIAKYKMKEYFDKGYSHQDVASMWLSGRPLKDNNRKDLATGISVPDYVKKFNEFYDNPKAAKYAKENPNMWKAAEYINKSPNLNSFLKRATEFTDKIPTPMDGIKKGAEYLNKSPKAARVVKTLSDFLEPAGDIAGGIGLGAMQGIGGSAASAGNLGIDAANLMGDFGIPNIPHPDLSRQMPQSAIGKGAGLVGDVLGQIVGGAGAFKALGAVPKLGNEASIFMNALRGAGAGGITGEDGLGGRLGSAALGAAFSPAAKLSNKSIMDRMVDSSNTQKSAAKKGFSDVFSNIAEGDIVIPDGNVDYKLIRKIIPDKERMVFDDYLKNPTAENAHWAQSLIGREVESLSKAIKDPKYKSPGRVHRLNKLRHAEKEIDDALNNVLKKYQGKENKYIQEKFNYKENVVPYDKLAIEKYKSGDEGADKMLKKLLEDYKFRNSPVIKKIHGKSLASKKFLNTLTGKDAGKFFLGALGLEGFNNARERYNNEE